MRQRPDQVFASPDICCFRCQLGSDGILWGFFRKADLLLGLGLRLGLVSLIVRVVVWVYRGYSLSCKGVVPKIPEKLQDGGWLS